MWKKQSPSSEIPTHFPIFSRHSCPKCKRKLEIWGLNDSKRKLEIWGLNDKNSEGGEESYPILVCPECDLFFDYYEFD